MSSTDRSPARIGIAERVDSKGRTQYRGTAYDRRAKRHLKGPWTSSLAEARSWRVDAMSRLQAGTLSAHRGPTVAEAVDEFLTGIQSGAIRRSDGHPYKPSTIRNYWRDLRKRVVPMFGTTRLGRLARADVQRWVDDLAAEGLAPSTVHNITASLAAVAGWAEARGYVHVTPCRGIRLPKGAEARDRVATPAEAAALIAALPPRDQAALGLAVYGGLRIGEVLALDVEAVDLDARTLHVRRGWDATAREFIATKSRRTRMVPIGERLARLVVDHLVLMDHPSEGLLFPGVDPRFPLHPRTLRRRAAKTWKRAGLEPLGFHEARHTYASIAIAAGLNAKTLSTYMGHANISITLDLYGHLLPGNDAVARDLLDAYLNEHGG
jgi:integrase